MKDYVLDLLSEEADTNTKLNLMREYLQAYVLRVLHEQGVFRRTAFVGGTALRFLHALPRFSEDLDLSLTGSGEWDFAAVLKKVKAELTHAGYDISLTYKDTQTVQYSYVKFPGLLYEAGISPHVGQVFSIKIEVDTRPPEGAALNTSVVNRFFPLILSTYDLPSLFAGKLHALLARHYVKGRDYFDLGWYLSKWKDLAPNMPLFQNALHQTGWEGEIPTPHSWRGLIHDVVRDADWEKVKGDVTHFLERPTDMDVFTKENLMHLLKKPS